MVSLSYKMMGVTLLVLCLSLVCAQDYCYQQNCRECEAAAEKVLGESVKCDVRSQVSVAWLNDSSFPILTPPSNNVTSEFLCIKMVGSKEKTDENGDSTDVIRGCSLRTLAQSTCDALVTLQASRNKKAVCHICEGNECNGSMATSGSLIMLLATTIIAKMLNQ